MRAFWGIILISLVVVACTPTAPTPLPPTRAATTPFLVTAWVEAGNLYVWQTGDTFARRVASGGAIQPFVAPDGRTIAFTRGPAGAPDSLWLVAADGTAEQQLVGDGNPASYRGAQIGQVVWWDAKTLYFNTLKRAVPAATPQHDLYRANVVTRDVTLLLSPGEGGRISLSPRRDSLVLVSAGDYGEQNGRIRVYDPLARTPPVDLLYFTGVATGAHSGFYPPITWTEDFSAVIAAIPDQDLLYNDEKPNAPETVLWRLPFAIPNARETIGTIPASFFGMPRWSDDGRHMLYLQRLDKDTFQITLADADGANPFPIETGKAGQIDMPTWISGSTRFFYTRGTAGALYTAALDELPTLLRPETILTPRFVTPERYVFLMPYGTTYDLRTVTGTEPDQPLAETGGLVVFDAVWVVPQI